MEERENITRTTGSEQSVVKNTEAVGGEGGGGGEGGWGTVRGRGEEGWGVGRWIGGRRGLGVKIANFRKIAYRYWP